MQSMVSDIKKYSNANISPILSVWYLGVPLMLWLYGHVQLWISLPLIALLLWVFTTVQFPASGKNFRSTGWAGGIAGALLCAALVFVLGFDGHVKQTYDFIARNAIYSDLIHKEWPVSYPDGRCLLYPSHFWVVPSLLSRVFPYMATMALQLWCFIGFALLYWNLCRRFGWKKTLLMVVALLSFCSLTQVVDNVLNVGFYKDAIYAATFGMPSNLSQYFNTFHYFIIVALCLSVMLEESTPWRSFVVVGFLLAAEHPMCAATVFPFVLWRAWGEAKGQNAESVNWHSWVKILNLKETWVGAVVVLVSLLYYRCGDSNTLELPFYAPFGPGMNVWGVFLYCSAVLLNALPLVLAWWVTRYRPLLLVSFMIPVIQICRFGCDNGINEWTYKSVCVFTFMLVYAIAGYWNSRKARWLLLALLVPSLLPIVRQWNKDKDIPNALLKGFPYCESNINNQNGGTMFNAEKNDYFQHTASSLAPSWLFKQVSPKQY